jgi:NAD-dependent SIR2 family protein deacetylase
MKELDKIYNINKNRLFILGAGFSAGAGIPLMDTLLKLTMDKFLKE